MIYITAEIPGKAVDYLRKEHEVIIDDVPPREKLLNRLESADAVISMLSDSIDKQAIDCGKKLKIIANYAVGYNNIDIDYATSKGIVVTNTPGVLTDATADLAWALILSLTRLVIPSDKYTREGKFKGWHPMLFQGTGLQGKNLGIFGMGRIGKAVAKRGKAFGMNIIYNNRNRDIDSEKTLDANFVSFAELLKKSDILSVHVPLTGETKNIIGSNELEIMKKTSYIINTARGPVIDEEALSRYLVENRIAGAGLDVYYNEPEIHPELIELKNVVLLPHLGSATCETREKMAFMVAENVLSVLKGGAPLNEVQS